MLVLGCFRLLGFGLCSLRFVWLGVCCFVGWLAGWLFFSKCVSLVLEIVVPAVLRLTCESCLFILFIPVLFEGCALTYAFAWPSRGPLGPSPSIFLEGGLNPACSCKMVSTTPTPLRG